MVVVVELPEPDVLYDEPEDVAVSIEAEIDVLVKSISNNWFLTGTISFVAGVITSRIAVEVSPSTLDMAVMLILFIDI